MLYSLVILPLLFNMQFRVGNFRLGEGGGRLIFTIEKFSTTGKMT